MMKGFEREGARVMMSDNLSLIVGVAGLLGGKAAIYYLIIAASVL